LNSDILKQIGLDGLDPGIYVIVLATCIVMTMIMIIICSVQVSKTKKLGKRIEALCAGKHAESLEEEIKGIISDNKYLMTQTEEHKGRIKNIYSRLEKNYQKMVLKHYDALDRLGGKMSFILVMLDENDDGFIINSVHGPEGCYVYARDVKAGSVNIEIGPDEQDALAEAKAIELA